jgi:hypothetical protein
MRRLVSLCLCSILFAGCAVADDDGFDDDVGETEQDVSTLWYTPITKEYFLPSAKIRTEVRKVFASEEEWVAFFGEPSPGIDFTKDLAIFYTPGTAREDLQVRGWRARLARVTLSSTGKTLSVTTRLEENGDCATRSTRPFITATVKRPATLPTYKKFYRDDIVRDCD